MTEIESRLAYLRDPRLAVHALAPAPVWLWSVDAARILWTNPVGALIFDAASPAAASKLSFDSTRPAAAQVARLVGTLPPGAAPRLERLRGFGGGIGGTLICLCSRITLDDNSSAILVVSTERAGKDLALPERARRLLDDLQPVAAIFTADGELIEARAAARERLGARLDLIALGAEKLAREATLNGTAEGKTKAGQASLLKLGAGPTFGLLVCLAERAPATRRKAASHAAEPPLAKLMPAAAEPEPQQLPMRFVWRTDADNHFSLTTQEFAALLGPRTVAALGRNWSDIARTLGLDPQKQFANALTSRATFSDIVMAWPIDGADERVAVEMSGLPTFDRERRFQGFRGFGICRDVSRLEEIQRRRQETVVAPSPPPPPAPAPEHPLLVPEPETKILPFPAASPPPPVVTEPALTDSEHIAFKELARELNERLKRPAAKSEEKSEEASEEKAADEPGSEPSDPDEPAPRERATSEPLKPAHDGQESRPILDRLPVGILVYRLNTLMYANRAFLA